MARMFTLFLLRFLAFQAILAAAILVVTTTVFGFDAPVFEYFMIANSIAAFYGFILLFLRFVLDMDSVITALFVSSIYMSLVISQSGMKGKVADYCKKVMRALVVCLVRLSMYLIFVMCSIYDEKAIPIVLAFSLMEHAVVSDGKECVLLCSNPIYSSKDSDDITKETGLTTPQKSNENGNGAGDFYFLMSSDGDMSSCVRFIEDSTSSDSSKTESSCPSSSFRCILDKEKIRSLDSLLNLDYEDLPWILDSDLMKMDSFPSLQTDSDASILSFDLSKQSEVELQDENPHIDFLRQYATSDFIDLLAVDIDEPLFWPFNQKLDWSFELTLKCFDMSPSESVGQLNPSSSIPLLIKECRGLSILPPTNEAKFVDYDLLKAEFSSYIGVPIEVLIGLEGFDGHEGVNTKFDVDGFILEGLCVDDDLLKNEFSSYVGVHIEKLTRPNKSDGHEGVETEFDVDGFFLEVGDDVKKETGPTTPQRSNGIDAGDFALLSWDGDMSSCLRFFEDTTSSNSSTTESSCQSCSFPSDEANFMDADLLKAEFTSYIGVSIESLIGLNELDEHEGVDDTFDAEGFILGGLCMDNEFSSYVGVPIEELIVLNEFSAHEGVETEFNADGFILELA